MATIMIPTPLRQFTGGAEVVDIHGTSVGQILSDLTLTVHPALRSNLYTPEGKLRSFVNIYLNDEDIRYLDKEHTAVSPTDVLSIVPSIAGGR